MAEVHTYAAQCPVGGGIIHLGATSWTSRTTPTRCACATPSTSSSGACRRCCSRVAERAEGQADAATMAFTHLQPAEPTTIGYRLAQYAQDLLEDWRELQRVRADLKGKGFKGAVGTSASYGQLLAGTPMTPAALEAKVMAALGMDAWPVATQTAPRKQELRVLSALSSMAQSLYKLAADLRLLQSPPIGELAEPFGKRQIGSSAMPFKRNPIHAENIDSLARHLAALPRVAWDNAAHSYLERTLDDSANRRSVLPEAFLLADELLARADRIMRGLVIDAGASRRLLSTYGPFAATERVLMQLARRGADRQVLHEVIRHHSMVAWAAIREGRANPLLDDLAAAPEVAALASTEEVRGWMDASDYVGDAPWRTRLLVSEIRSQLDFAAAI
jgi:adenylosuccinate lyase